MQKPKLHIPFCLPANSSDARIAESEPRLKRRGYQLRRPHSGVGAPTKTSGLKASRGFGLVEVIVVLAIIVTVFAGLLELAIFEQRAQRVASEEAAAYILAREALEATRSVRDDNWDDIVALAVDTPYYPVIQANRWILTTVDPGPVGVYQRYIGADNVLRDASDNIAASGTVDADTRKITAYVTWTDAFGKARSIQLDTYFTNWQGYQ